jgi:phosphoglycolate phosphatase
VIHCAAVLFDLDGTLLDTAPDMGAALNALRRECGKQPLPAEQIRPRVSHGSTGLLDLGFPDADVVEIERLRARFLALYAGLLADRTRPFDGIEPVLHALESGGLRWGVVTNKPGWLTDPLLERLDLARRSGCVVSGDTVAERKPHPLPLLHAARLLGLAARECVYVGDAERDIIAGRAAGMLTVVATYGYVDTHENTAAWGADHAVGHPLELLDLIARPARRT